MKSTISPHCHAWPRPARRQANVRGIQKNPAVRNVKMALFENIVLLLHPPVDVPYSLAIT